VGACCFLTNGRYSTRLVRQENRAHWRGSEAGCLFGGEKVDVEVVRLTGSGRRESRSG